MATANLHEAQTARSVLMVRPSRFGANPATAASNSFQARSMDEPVAAVRARAAQEFDALATALAGAGVEVCVASDTPDPEKPDAIFPNNWVSFHADGTVNSFNINFDAERSVCHRNMLVTKDKVAFTSKLFV